MIATIAVIAAIAEKKSSAIAEIIAIIRKPLSSDRSDNDRTFTISATVVAAIAEKWFPYDCYDRCDRWTFFFSAAVVVFIWKPGFKVETVALGNKIGRS